MLEVPKTDLEDDVWGVIVVTNETRETRLQVIRDGPYVAPAFEWDVDNPPDPAHPSS